MGALYCESDASGEPCGDHKVVRYGLDLQCFPDAYAAELGEKQKAQQWQKLLGDEE